MDRNVIIPTFILPTIVAVEVLIVLLFLERFISPTRESISGAATVEGEKH
jgi:hypothetical protein